MPDERPFESAASLPVTTPTNVEPDQPTPRPELPWWKISTAMLAVLSAALLVWGMSTAKNLQAQVDSLQATGQQQQVEAEVTSEVTEAISDAQVEVLESQLRILGKSLKTLGKQAGVASDAADKERSRSERQLVKAEDAVTALRVERGSAGSDTESVLAAYQDAQDELVATQAAMAELLDVVVQDVSSARWSVLPVQP